MTSATARPPVAAIPADRATQASLSRFLPLLAGIVVVAVGALIVDGQPVGAIRDDSMYVLLAKALATGHGYRWLHLPGTPAAIHFPPGYPAVLALLWTLFPAFPGNVIVFKLANALFAGAAAFGVARLARTRFAMSEVAAQGFAIAALLASPVLALVARVMSEPLFLALLVPALLLAERAVADSKTRARDLVVLGVLSGCITLVRTHGIALLAAILVLLFMRRRFRDAGVFAAVAVTVLVPWQWWVAAHSGTFPLSMRGNYESYAGWLVDGFRTHGVALLGRTALRTTGDLASMLQIVLAPSLPSLARILALLVFVALAALGARRAWRLAPVYTVFLAVYGLIVVLWPFAPARFVWCVWPLILLLPVTGAREILAARPTRPNVRMLRYTTLAATALLACGYAAFNVVGYRARSWSSASYAAYLRPMLVWVATHTPRDALLASEAEGTVYLYTGRHTVPVGSLAIDEYFRTRTAADAASAIDTIVQRYHPQAVIVADGFLRIAVRELAFRQPPVLALVDTIPGGGLVLVPTPR
ncbi:MAG TPA: hypothetical protein VH539_09475 [Gemmatimonadaceae bacterium]|jgi:hypothetical protein